MFLSSYNSLVIFCGFIFLIFYGFHRVIPLNILCFIVNTEPKLCATSPSQSIIVLPLERGGKKWLSLTFRMAAKLSQRHWFGTFCFFCFWLDAVNSVPVKSGWLLVLQAQNDPQFHNSHVKMSHITTSCPVKISFPNMHFSFEGNI